MTSPTLSSSVKDTIKELGPEADSFGPLPRPIEPDSEPTSGGKKTWLVKFMDGEMSAYELPGKNGRISYSAPRGEVRIYRDATTKVFDALLTGVERVVSESVEVRVIQSAPQPTKQGLEIPF